jgi:glycosyltransferase involved in cell wall biosynthesis
LQNNHTLDVSVVVPYFNPGERLRPTVEALLETLGTSGLDYEIIAVSDGSTDGSEATITDLPPSLVRHLWQIDNHGKGEALRVGFQQARGRYVAFIDADGDLPPAQLGPMLRRVLQEDPDILVGSKRDPASVVANSRLRRTYSYLWHQLVTVPFHLTVGDTQTGLKVFRADVVDQVLPLTREQGFAFDLEFLVVAKHLGFTRIIEAPVQIIPRTTSTVSLRSALSMLRQTERIFARLHFSATYDGDKVPAAIDAPHQSRRAVVARAA